MQLTVNGVGQDHPEGLRGAQLLERIDWTAATLVAEVNGAIVRRAEFLELELHGGDVIELVTVVGGG